MNAPFRKFPFVLAFFTVETIFESICIWLQTVFAQHALHFSFGFVTNWFLNALLIVAAVKIILFLPVYLIFYLYRKNITSKFMLYHFVLHSVCLGIVCLIFFKYMVNKQGLISFGLMTYGSIIAAFIFNQVLIRGAKQKPVDNTTIGQP